MAIGVVDFLLAGLRDSSGNPLAGGKIHTYAAGTTTPKATYTEDTGTTPETNPVVLDANGVKQIFAQGAYKFVVTDADDTELYTWDDLYFQAVNNFGGSEISNIGNATARSSAISFGQVQDGNPPYVASVGGSANAITLSPAVIITAYATGQLFRFKAATSNTGTTTVNVSTIGAKTIKKAIGGVKFDLVAGDIIANDFHDILYDGTDFILYNPLQQQEYAGLAGGSANALTATIYSMTAYAAGQEVFLLIGSTNTGATTLNLNGLGAKNIYIFKNGGPVALTGGELQAGGQIAHLVYDGFEFILLNPFINATPNTYTPTLGTLSGSLSATSSSGRYSAKDGQVVFDATFTLTLSGGPSAGFSFTLPDTPINTNYVFPAYLFFAAATKVCLGKVTSGNVVTVYDSTFPSSFANGIYIFTCSGAFNRV